MIELVLRRNPELELLAVCHHVEGLVAHHRQQPDHAHHLGLAYQHVAVDLFVFGDFALLGSAGGGGNVYRGVQGLDFGGFRLIVATRSSWVADFNLAVLARTSTVRVRNRHPVEEASRTRATRAGRYLDRLIQIRSACSVDRISQYIVTAAADGSDRPPHTNGSELLSMRPPLFDRRPHYARAPPGFVKIDDVHCCR